MHLHPNALAPNAWLVGRKCEGGLHSGEKVSTNFIGEKRRASGRVALGERAFGRRWVLRGPGPEWACLRGKGLLQWLPQISFRNINIPRLATLKIRVDVLF